MGSSAAIIFSADIKVNPCWNIWRSDDEIELTGEKEMIDIPA